MTRCVEIGRQIFEHRRLNAPIGFCRRDCQPYAADIDYLSERAHCSGYTIILETSEQLACIGRKFAAVPGIIFITEFGRVVSRGGQELVLDNFVPRPGPALEFGKLRRVFSLCNNMANVGAELIEAIVPEPFLPCDISDSPRGVEPAVARSF